MKNTEKALAKGRSLMAAGIIGAVADDRKLRCQSVAEDWERGQERNEGQMICWRSGR